MAGVRTRTRTSAKAAGTRFNQAVVDYLAEHIDPVIERRTLRGAKDRGDVSGLRHMGGRVVVECKDFGGRAFIGPWLHEAEVERGNDDALAAVVVFKRKATTNPASQVVTMTLGDFVALMTGHRP